MLVRFFRTYDHVIINLKLMIIYILNLLDIIFTVVLLKTGYFQEANFLMRSVVEDLNLSFLVKGLLPLILLILLSVRIRKADERQRKLSNIAISGCMLYYGIINLSHIMWTISYLIQ